MKRIANFGIVALMTLTLMACNQDDEPTTKKPPGKIIELTVANQKVMCPSFLGESSPTPDCLSVHQEGFEAWEPLIIPIEGFAYQEGSTYHIRVQIEPVENPMADAADVKYKLLEVVSKTPAP